MIVEQTTTFAVIVHASAGAAALELLLCARRNTGAAHPVHEARARQSTRVANIACGRCPQERLTPHSGSEADGNVSQPRYRQNMPSKTPRPDMSTTLLSTSVVGLVVGSSATLGLRSWKPAKSFLHPLGLQQSCDAARSQGRQSQSSVARR